MMKNRREVVRELSVFFPAYNEEKNIGSVVRKALGVLESLALERYEVVVVDDGSSDGTLEAAQKLAAEFPSVRVVRHPSNRGYGAALRSGFYKAKYAWIVFTDGDGQFDFSEVVGFFKKQRETQADLVVGFYRERKVPLRRKLNTLLWDSLMKILFGIRVRDIDCAFKLIRKEVVEAIPKLESERGAFISTELLAKVAKGGFKIAEVGVTHYPRLAGEETGADFKVILRSFVDLFRLWGKLR